VANANLLQQGTGLLNVDGAVSVAKALRTDLASARAAGTIYPGMSMIAPGQAMPAATSTHNGSSFNWSGMIFVGGRQVVCGSALMSYQPFYDGHAGVVGQQRPGTDAGPDPE
jgi:serine protease AprX